MAGQIATCSPTSQCSRTPNDLYCIITANVIQHSPQIVKSRCFSSISSILLFLNENQTAKNEQPRTASSTITPSVQPKILDRRFSTAATRSLSTLVPVWPVVRWKTVLLLSVVLPSNAERAEHTVTWTSSSTGNCKVSGPMEEEMQRVVAPSKVLFRSSRHGSHLIHGCDSTYLRSFSIQGWRHVTPRQRLEDHTCSCAYSFEAR